MEESWIKIYRKIKAWTWFTDSKTLHVFLYLLLSANIKDGNMKGRTVKRGQVVTSYFRIATSTGMSVSSARRAIDNLISTGEITAEATNRYTIITIVKYENYQEKYANFEQPNEHATEQHHKKGRRKKEKTPEVPAPAKKEEPESPGAYIPQYWERSIPEKYYGLFQTEDDWWKYAEEHRAEIEDAAYGV